MGSHTHSGLRFFVVFASVLVFALSASVSEAKDKKTCSVHKIFIETMGEGPEADQLAILVEKELREEKFDVVPSPSDADAVLAGTLVTKERVRGSYAASAAGDTGSAAGSVRSYTEASVTITLKDPSGTMIWRTVILPGLVCVGSSLECRAEDIAEELKDACRHGWKED